MVTQEFRGDVVCNHGNVPDTPLGRVIEAIRRLAIAIIHCSLCALVRPDCSSIVIHIIYHPGHTLVHGVQRLICSRNLVPVIRVMYHGDLYGKRCIVKECERRLDSQCVHHPRIIAIGIRRSLYSSLSQSLFHVNWARLTSFRAHPHRARPHHCLCVRQLPGIPQSSFSEDVCREMNCIVPVHCVDVHLTQRCFTSVRILDDQQVQQRRCVAPASIVPRVHVLVHYFVSLIHFHLKKSERNLKDFRPICVKSYRPFIWRRPGCCVQVRRFLGVLGKPLKHCHW